MADNNEDLKKQIEKLNQELEEVKKQLAENKASDEQRHEEVKQLQKDHHKENLIWNKITGLGALATPATILLTLLSQYLRKKDKGKNEEREDKGKNQDMSALTELIREIKK